MKRVYVLSIAFFLSIAIVAAAWFFGRANIPVAHDLCGPLNQVIAATDNDFKAIKGAKVPPQDTADLKNPEFFSTVKIPETFNDVLSFSADDSLLPMFIATIYQGADSLTAYHQYLKFNQQFMDCEPGWKIGDKNNFEKMPGFIYVVFISGDKVVYITYKRERKTFSTMLMVMPAG